VAESIAASTLLLTAITLLCTAWYGEMKKAPEDHIPPEMRKTPGQPSSESELPAMGA
jgi:hypothetical protein